MGRVKKFTTLDASKDWIKAVETAINNMNEEISKKPDKELSGSSRKAELGAIKETALACKELILEREKMVRMMEEFEKSGGIEEEKDFSGSFAERNASR